MFVGDLERIQDEAERRAIPTTGRPVPEYVDGIRFETVSFTYPGKDNKPALDGDDLHIPAGATAKEIHSRVRSGRRASARACRGVPAPSGRVASG
ncbi:hypothetical protein ADK86_39965 [Streptomyces sp. NRRL F-5755]|uniref:hypothetical protein n=1 Tax=Streptomyces sp. NRRL F-5755 TaxID=1519475 RepID=UPI0006AFFEBB|nr:hypothetical protein [Streptomyces sp. NRRL F-5755]KOT86207.1 hypothetical protein ADK86_39965 [Streptomyces sp. NRRL F-5755]